MDMARGRIELPVHAAPAASCGHLGTMLGHWHTKALVRA